MNEHWPQKDCQGIESYFRQHAIGKGRIMAERGDFLKKSVIMRDLSERQSKQRRV